MDIYFVRHGQTSGNLAKRHQAEHTPLTPAGRVQVEATAEQLRALQPTYLIASTHVRTLETARIIGEVCDLVPETNRLFVELYRPNDVYGHRHFSVRSLWYIVRWFFGYAGGVSVDDPQGESYAAFRERIAAARAFLAEMPADARVVVVSHSIFINFFIAHMCQEKRLSLFGAVRLWFQVHKTHNGSIVHVRHKSRKGVDGKTCKWQLVKAS